MVHDVLVELLVVLLVLGGWREVLAVNSEVRSLRVLIRLVVDSDLTVFTSDDKSTFCLISSAGVWNSVWALGVGPSVRIDRVDWERIFPGVTGCDSLVVAAGLEQQDLTKVVTDCQAAIGKPGVAGVGC